MKIKTVNLNLESCMYIKIPYPSVSKLEFNGVDITKCDIAALRKPNLKIRFKRDLRYFGYYDISGNKLEDEQLDWVNTSNRYDVVSIEFFFEDGTSTEIELPWEDDDEISMYDSNRLESVRHIGGDVVIEVKR